MPIYKGLNKIGAIYKGSTKIDKVYKGSILVYSSAYWLAYSFDLLYNSLIPTTISGKSVQDKLRITAIEGNSEVVNQLAGKNNLTSTTVSDVVFTQTDDRKGFVANGTASADGIVAVSYYDVSVPDNHKMLIWGCPAGGSASTYYMGWVLNESPYDYGNGVIRNGNTSAPDRPIIFYFKSGVTFNNVLIKPQVRDLTQDFPFDTPTSLDDPRVQKILNGDYIAYNTGTIKSVDVSEFSSKPYNLFDAEWEQGGIGDTSGNNYSDNAKIRTVGYIQVIGNTDYTLIDNIVPSSSSQVKYIFEYDENKNYLAFSRTYGNWPNWDTWHITLKQNTKFVRLSYSIGTPTTTSDVGNICFHRTGTRTGYAPHTSPATLPFIYQGSGVGTAHDSMEITDTEYVFTKKMREVNLGSLTWDVGPGSSGNYWYSTSISAPNPTDANTKPNIISQNYIADTWIHIYGAVNNNAIGIQGNFLRVQNGSTTTSPTGIAVCELNTPQVTRIPKKHLGIVDLGSLSWSALGSGANDYATSNGIASLVKKPESYSVLSNIYSSNYLSETGSHVYLHSVPKCICITVDGNIGLYDADLVGKTGAEIAAAMSGIYLFYETEDEVADIDTEISIEAGGTLTSDSEVITDVDTEVKCK